MSNALGNYNEVVYAQEALTILHDSLGLANRVARGAEAARNASFAKGDTIKLRRPSVFTAQTAPSTSAQDVATDSYSLVLDQWFDVLIALRDDEMTFTREQMLKAHVIPAAQALGRKFDAYLKGLYVGIADYIDVASTAVPADIIAARKALFDNGVPVDDEANMHFLVDSDMEADFLNSTVFNSAQSSGMSPNEVQLRGHIGRKFGFEIFANQTIPSHVPGTCNDTALLINNGAGYAAGIATINLDAADAGVTGTLVAGDILAIGGKNYVVTATFTASGNAFTGVTISPPLAAAVVDNAVVTAKLTASKRQCLAFHRDFMHFASAPLATSGDGQGARMSSVFDPEAGLGLRVTTFYDALNAKNYMRVDALGGAKIVQPRMAVRAYNS